MTTPHFSAPFRFTSVGSVAVDDQDTLPEVRSCVLNVVDCFLGDCPDIPSFGIPNPLFKNAPIDVNAIQQAILTWEPRATILSISDVGDPIDPSNRTISVKVGA